MFDPSSPVIVTARPRARFDGLKRISGAVFAYAVARLSEASTWRGIIGVLTGLGAVIEPTLAVKIIAMGTLAAGAVGSLFGDKVPVPPAAE